MDIIQTLAEMNGGGALAHMNSKFRELNEAVKGTLGKGKLIITVSVSPGRTEMGGNLGHAFTEQNTYVRPNGSRLCRECIRAKDRNRRDAAWWREYRKRKGGEVGENNN